MLSVNIFRLIMLGVHKAPCSMPIMNECFPQYLMVYAVLTALVLWNENDLYRAGLQYLLKPSHHPTILCVDGLLQCEERTYTLQSQAASSTQRGYCVRSLLGRAARFLAHVRHQEDMPVTLDLCCWKVSSYHTLLVICTAVALR